MQVSDIRNDYEIIEGVKFMAPSPKMGHVNVTANLLTIINSYARMCTSPTAIFSSLILFLSARRTKNFFLTRKILHFTAYPIWLPKFFPARQCNAISRLKKMFTNATASKNIGLSILGARALKFIFCATVNTNSTTYIRTTAILNWRSCRFGRFQSQNKKYFRLVL